MSPDGPINPTDLSRRETPLSGLFQRRRVFSHHRGFQAANFFRHGQAYKVIEGNTILGCHQTGAIS
jgi:hypothetical protein